MNDRQLARTVAEHVEHAKELMAALPGFPPVQRWDMPFPLAVFGTLREGCVNHHLMQQGNIAAWRRAFLPHFVAREINLFHQHGASAPFEIYFYDPLEWEKVIGPVDELEDFLPERPGENWYQRTLAWLRLLPEDYDHPLYPSRQLDGERSLAIAADSWEVHESVPCWIYSTIEETRKAAGEPGSPIIWDDVVRR